MKKKIFFALLATASLAALAAAATVLASDKKSESEPSAAEQKNTETLAADVSIFVQGFEWGPGVPKLILELPSEASRVSAKDLQVSTLGTERTITDLYLCDADGTRVDGPSHYAAINLETSYKVSGCPFHYDMTIRMNKWADSYPVIITSSAFLLDDHSYLLDLKKDCINRRICPDTARFSARGSHTGVYRNSFTKKDEEITLRTAAYEPPATESEEKMPLIIWLHGQGEGGTDVDIELLGNEVCALAREEIQSHFSSGNQKGAYVLAVQCETYWMDEGDGTNGQGSGVSRYTEALMDTISDYVTTHPEVDPNRIYLGGCSNGGYMTMNMLVHYPDYFAAAYPNCEAYSFYEYVRKEDDTYTNEISDSRWVTEETIETLKNIPIWFILSANDTVVNPVYYELPTYQALLQAGAQNAWLSLFESVEGTDSPGTSYPGHFSWIYTLKDQVTGVQNRDAIASADAADLSFGTAPTNDGGGSEKAGEFDNLFDWMNAQSR